MSRFKQSVLGTLSAYGVALNVAVWPHVMPFLFVIDTFLRSGTTFLRFACFFSEDHTKDDP